MELHEWFCKMENMRKPDFNQLLKVFKRDKPDRPVVFDFFLNDDLYQRVTGKHMKKISLEERMDAHLETYLKHGYDYLTIVCENFKFVQKDRPRGKSFQMTGNGMITCQEDFEQYTWPKVSEMRSDVLDMSWAKRDYDGLKLIVYGPGGILENTTDILGFDNMCYMIYDEPELIEQIFSKVGSLMLEYYKAVVDYETVGAIIYNDDWGYKSQTLVSPETLRQYIFPWVKQIVELAHSRNKPIMLHSCGNLDQIMDDIYELGFDAKHSYEDSIHPVEEAYLKYIDKIAVIGGIDVNFICRSTPDEVKTRCSNMLKIAEEKGGYALGTGNSVPDYVPYENYCAMLSAAL